jgi:hypothetical protein
MTTFERRASERRGLVPSSAISLGGALEAERRDRSDRREQPRRHSDLRTIAHYARRIEAEKTRLEVIIDGTEGLRLVAMFECGCVAFEPVGAGPVGVSAEPCAEHAPEIVSTDRRRSNR